MRFTEWNSKKSKEYRYFREKGQRYNDQQENDRHRQDQNDSTQDRHNRRQNENDLDMEDANPIMKNSPKKNQKWNQTKMNQTTPRVSTKTQHLIHPIAGKPRLPKTKNKLINLNVSIPNNPQTQGKQGNEQQKQMNQADKFLLIDLTPKKVSHEHPHPSI